MTDDDCVLPANFDGDSCCAIECAMTLGERISLGCDCDVDGREVEPLFNNSSGSGSADRPFSIRERRRACNNCCSSSSSSIFHSTLLLIGAECDCEVMLLEGRGGEEEEEEGGE